MAITTKSFVSYIGDSYNYRKVEVTRSAQGKQKRHHPLPVAYAYFLDLSLSTKNIMPFLRGARFTKGINGVSQYTGLSLVPIDQMAGVFSAAMSSAQKVNIIRPGWRLIWLRRCEDKALVYTPLGREHGIRPGIYG